MEEERAELLQEGQDQDPLQIDVMQTIQLQGGEISCECCCFIS